LAAGLALAQGGVGNQSYTVKGIVNNRGIGGIVLAILFGMVGMFCLAGALPADGRITEAEQAKDFSELAQRLEGRWPDTIRRDKDGAVVYIDPVGATDDEMVLISREPSVRELTFYGPQVTDKGIATLGRMTNLTSLKIARRDIMQTVCQLSRLQRLNLWCTRMKPSDLPYLIKMTNLEDLDVRGVWEMGTNSISAMTNLTHLKRLVLGGGGGESPARWIAEFRTNEHGNGTNWDGWDYPKTNEFKALTNLTALEELQIFYFTNFGDEQLRELARCTSLKSLILHDTQVSDNWSNIVSQFPSLTNAERSIFDPRLSQKWSRAR
jgi:hypothetical protein